tara:strand:+ start:9 stop:377 length:369 start_codon:yes stop_codon:yes gene_type:complete
MALSPNNTLQQNLFETIKSNMENKDFTIDDKDSNKITELSENLSQSIKYFINSLTFKITNAEMSTILTNIQGVPNAGGPVTIPFIDLTVAISDAGDKTQNPKGKIESIKSEVKVDEAKMRSL